MTSSDSRFEPDPDDLVPATVGLPAGWEYGSPDPSDRFEITRLTQLLRAHEHHGRGWAGSGVDDILVEVSEAALRTRANLVVRDTDQTIQAWASVHDRAGGRMLLVHVVARELPDEVAQACSQVLLTWAEGQARSVGEARGLSVQQIDTGAFADDQRQHDWLAGAGFDRVRTWWQMSRPVTADEATLVPSVEDWERKGVRFRQVRRSGAGTPDAGMPDEADLRAVHDVLEEAFVEHFNSQAETFDEFVNRLREDPGHRWDHWWLAELVDGESPEAVGALVGTVSESSLGPDGSYVSYLGVRSAARGRGVAKGLLHTIIADAASRGRDRVGLEVDADSPSGADGMYVAMGWQTRYITESWHRDVTV